MLTCGRYHWLLGIMVLYAQDLRIYKGGLMCSSSSNQILYTAFTFISGIPRAKSRHGVGSCTISHKNASVLYHHCLVLWYAKKKEKCEVTCRH
jgi:hypothetical protein